MVTLIRFWVCLVVLLFITVSAMASEGVFMLGNDAQQLGRASSGVASPRSAYWSYLNPATMVDLDRRLDIDLYTVALDVDLNPNGPLGNWLDGRMESKGIWPVLSGGMIWPLEEGKGTLGGGVFVPSGTGVEYPHSRNIITRLFQGDHDRQLEYQHIRFVLAYAYPLENGWSIGAGFHTSLTRFRSDHLTLGLCPAKANFDWDEALGIGMGVGIYKKWDRWAFGASYDTPHLTQDLDKYSDLLGFPLDTPQVAQVGLSYKLTDRLELTGDIKYLNWKRVKTYSNCMLKGGFNWDDQLGYKLGLDYKLNDTWTLMAGFAHTNMPIDEDHAFLSALVPVAVEDHATAGFTYHLGEHHEIHCVLIHAFRNSVEDTGRGSNDILSLLGKGSTVTAAAESICIGYSYKF